jgi:protein SCO1
MHVSILPVSRVLRALVVAALAYTALAHTALAQSPTPRASTPTPVRGSMYALDAKWTTQDGRVMQLADMRGEVVVLAMVYTSCTMTCPLLTNEMLAVQRALPPAIRSRTRFVLASFDPARDSVPVLREYATKMSLDGQWLALRASAADVRQLAVLLGVKYRALPSGDFEHSNIISVLDAQGVRRYHSERVPVDRPALVGAVMRTAGRVSVEAQPRTPSFSK